MRARIRGPRSERGRWALLMMHRGAYGQQPQSLHVVTGGATFRTASTCWLFVFLRVGCVFACVCVTIVISQPCRVKATPRGFGAPRVRLLEGGNGVGQTEWRCLG